MVGERLTIDSKIKQFIEKFGLWLKIHKESGNIDTLIAAAKAKYQAGNYRNPSYTVLQHYGLSGAWAISQILNKAIDIDIYNVDAYYYATKCLN
jgi:hypothetical protein